MSWIKYILLITTILVYACNKEHVEYNSKLVGHAGNGLDVENQIYASNSKEAIELAISLEGSNGVEIDVQMSQNGTLWLFHDQSLDESTNSVGCIPELTDSYLSNVKFNTINKERLTRLNDLDFANYPDVEFVIDVKFYTPCVTTDMDEMTDALVQFNSTHPELKLSYISNQKAWVEVMINKGLPTFYEVEELVQDELIDGIKGVVMRQSKIQKEDVENLHNLGLEVIMFDIRAPKIIKQALDKKGDILIVDDLRAAIIEKYN